MFLIVTTYIFRIGSLKNYNVIRKKLQEHIKLFSLSSNSSFFEYLINITYNDYTFNRNYNQEIKSYTLINFFPFVNSYCDYNKYLSNQCNKSEYERDNGCNFDNLKKRKCIFKEYVQYCKDEYFKNKYCNEIDHEFYTNSSFRCDYFYNYIKVYNKRCSEEQNNYFRNQNDLYEKNIPAYIIDYTSSKYFCDHTIYEKVVFIFSFILLLFAFFFILFILIYQKLKIIQIMFIISYFLY